MLNESCATTESPEKYHLRLPRTIRLYHGTTRTFEKFRRRKDDLGIHLGTREHANERLHRIATVLRKGEPAGERIFPVEVTLRNPLRMPDLGHWNALNVGSWLLGEGIVSRQEIEHARGTAGLRRLLQHRGNDAVVYVNQEEVTGMTEAVSALQSCVRELAVLARSLGRWSKELHEHPVNQRRLRAEAALLKLRLNALDDSYIIFDPDQIRRAHLLPT